MEAITEINITQRSCKFCGRLMDVRFPKRKKLKKDQSYYYLWYMVCKHCNYQYNDPDGKRLTSEIEDTLTLIKSTVIKQCKPKKKHNTKTVVRRNLPYSEYLLTDHWKETRLRSLSFAKHRCQLCRSNKQLNVHHNNYNRMWNEMISDLVVLCSLCHSKFHDKLPLQPEYVNGKAG